MSEKADTPPRSSGKWAILLAAWGAGLVVFAMYLGFIAYVVFRWLG